MSLLEKLRRKDPSHGGDGGGVRTDVGPLLQQAVGQLQGGRWRDAISSLETALAAAPDHPGVHAYLIQAFARSGDGPGALRHYERCRSLDPAMAAKVAKQDPWLQAGPSVVKLGESRYEQKTYVSYACSDPSVAKEFLRSTDVDRPMYYLQVDTPDGTWGKDIDGLYQPGLPAWKTDLSLADCDGAAVGIPDRRGFEYCVKGMSDNFVDEVRCGRCEHRWLDALRHGALSVVRCPSCGAYNRINTDHIHSILISEP
jgi:hypothetical protein